MPYYMTRSVTWAGPGGTPLRSEVRLLETLTKVPHFNQNDEGTYVCAVQPKYNYSGGNFSFDVDVKADVSGGNPWGRQSRGDTAPRGCGESSSK